MESRTIALSLLFVVLVSGCIHGGNDGDSGRAITVTQLNVQPQEIYEGTSVTVSMDVRNTGKLPAVISLGNRGTNVLKNHCPDIFTIPGDGYTVTTSGDRQGDRVRLKPDRELRMRWELRQEGDVPLYGFRCDLEFELPFNYSVNAYRQVQIKRNRDVSGSPNLQFESSRGPLMFALETLPGSTGRPDTFVSDRDESITLLLQLQNLQEEEYNKGVIDINEQSLEVTASDPLQLSEGYTSSGWTVKGGYSNARCDVSDNELRIFEGKSQVLKCSVPVPDVGQPSQISEFFAEVNYTYLRDVASRRVEVMSSG